MLEIFARKKLREFSVDIDTSFSPGTSISSRLPNTKIYFCTASLILSYFY